MLLLPRNYLSYSARTLWLTNKQGFRDYYYEGKKAPETEYTIFGSEIHKLIEEKKLKIKGHRSGVYKNEVKMTANLKGIPLLGYLDLFEPYKLAVTDIKTGIRKPDGKPRWDTVAVHKLDQLPFYAMLIDLNYGKYFRLAKLVWLPTEWQEYNEEMEFDGHTLIQKRRKLVLTGEQQTFRREIEPWEIERQKEITIKAAVEISEDYTKWKESQTYEKQS